MPNGLLPHVSICTRLHGLLNRAFPPINPVPTDLPTVASFQRAVHALDGPLNILVSPLDRSEPVHHEYATLSLEARIPALLVTMLERMLAFRKLGAETQNNKAIAPAWRDYIPVMRHRAARQIIDAAIVSVLRAMNAFTNGSDLFAASFAADTRLLLLLFDAMHSTTDSVELALALLEEVLHAPRQRPDLDISTIPQLPALISSFTPFQLGSFCRVLAPLVDERDVPLCGGDHCSGACTSSSPSASHDWQQIEPATKQLRARRSYVGATSRAVRDRNHAVLLAVPGLVQKLAKLISVPPAPRDELAFVDHALRSGVFTLNFDILQESPQQAQPVALQAALVASVRAEQGGEVVLQQVGGAEPPPPETPGPEESEALPPLEDIRERVLFMVFRRFTGMDSEDADLAGTERWEVLDVRIKRAARDHANGRRDARGVFRERRRRSGPERLGVGLRVAPGETDGIVEVTALMGLPTNGGEGAIAGNTTPNTDSGTNTPPGGGRNGDGPSVATSPTRRREGEGGRGRRRDESMDPMDACPHLSINGLLMSSHQVEVLFVLYSLLIGRRKTEVQVLLIDADIFAVLHRFCDSLDWSKSERETRTEESLKVHFIRLLHYLWDGLDIITPEDRLELLFSEHERDLLKSIEVGHVSSPDPFGPLLVSPASTSSQEPLLLGLRNLSLNSCADSKVVTPSGAIRNETGSSRSRFHSSPIRSSRPSNYLGGNCSPIGADAECDKDHGEDEIPISAESMSERITSADDIPSNKERGIVCKMTRILMMTLGDDERLSTRRCLLSGCIETYLRSASIHEKTMVAHQGLLVHLLKQLSESDHLTPQITQFRQTSFDLLGQLVKWNRDVFSFMNELFRQDPKLLPQLLKAVSDRLIDSNVFVRSVVISLERFRGEDELARSSGEADGTNRFYDFDNCLLWEFVETNRTRLIHDLVSSVRVEDVNFENICCVNTTLILLVTSCSDDQALDLALCRIADIVLSSLKVDTVGAQSLFVLRPVDIFENFDKLVDFWLNYYQHQSLDVASQELSSNIHFDRLASMANLLRDRLPLVSTRIRTEAKIIRQQ